jgi:hypothetical protein
MLGDVFSAVAAHASMVDVTNVLGAEYREEFDAPPRLVWMPSSDTFEPGKRINNPGLATPGLKSKHVSASVGTRWAGVRVLVWAETDAPTKTAAADLEATEDLVRRLLVAVHETCFGNYRVQSLEWTGADGAELVQKGRACIVSMSFAIPIFKDAPSTGVLANITTAGMEGAIALPSGDITATPSP